MQALPPVRNANRSASSTQQSGSLGTTQASNNSQNDANSKVRFPFPFTAPSFLIVTTFHPCCHLSPSLTSIIPSVSTLPTADAVRARDRVHGLVVLRAPYARFRRLLRPRRARFSALPDSAPVRLRERPAVVPRHRARYIVLVIFFFRGEQE